MSETKKFQLNKLFKNSAKTGLIPNTAFPEFDQCSKFHSEKNKKPSRLNAGIITMSLSYKIANAMVESQNPDYNVFVCQQEDHEFYLVTCSGGSVGKNNYFIVDFKDNDFAWTNVYSHLLFKGLIAIDRYENPNGEIDNYFRQIDFSRFVDADQKKQFYITADSLYFNVEPLNNVNIEVHEEKSEIYKECAKYITKDITAFVRNDYDKIELSEAAKALGIKKTGLAMEKPMEREVPLTRAQRMKKVKETPHNMFEEKEIKAMPALLKNGYEMATKAFQDNKEFFGIDEWSLVEEIYEGDVRSINFTGPAGVGKTTIIRAIAGALGMPFVLVGGSEGIEESHLLGTREVISENGTSVTTWVDGPITTAIRYGGFLLFDEVNSAEPGVLMKLNTILDGSKEMILPTGESVKVHPKFVYADAMNVGAAYVGTNQVNMSHIDRIDQVFKIGAKEVAEEAKIIAANTGYENMDNLLKVCRIKKSIIQIIEEEGDEAEMIISPRRLINWVKKARRTNEWIESSLNTVISHLSIYIPDVECLTVEEVLNSNSCVSRIMMDIQKEFDGVTY